VESIRLKLRGSVRVPLLPQLGQAISERTPVLPDFSA
jgi:hypothetical protein